MLCKVVEENMHDDILLIHKFQTKTMTDFYF